MRIFRNPPNLQNAVMDLGLENDESYVNNLLKQCTRRFMNLNKLEQVIFNSLTKISRVQQVCCHCMILIQNLLLNQYDGSQ